MFLGQSIARRDLDVAVGFGEERFDLVCLLGDWGEGAPFRWTFRTRVLRCGYAFGNGLRHSGFVKQR